MKRLSLIPTALALITAVSMVTGNESTPAVSRSGHIFITTADGELVVLNPDKSEAARTANDHAKVKSTDVLPTPDFVALGYTVYPTESQFGSQYAVTLTPNGFIGGNWQTYTTDSLLTPYVHRPATTAAASYRIFPEWTSPYAPPSNPRTYRPRQLLGLNARGQALLRADVYDPNAGMQYLGQAYVVHTPTRTGYQDITPLVSGGAQINGLTDDGKLYGYVYRDGLPTGFVATPSN